MQKTVSATPLEAVKIEHRPDGLADVWLRKNIIRQTTKDKLTEEPREEWTADEVHIVEAVTQDEAEASFGELWHKATIEEMPQDERIRELESINHDLQTQVEEQAGAIEELALLMAGGE